MYWVDGTVGYAILLNDPRQQDALLQSQKGESFFHGPTGAFIRFKADGSICLFTTDDNTTNGRSVYLTISPTGLEFNFPFGKLTYDSNGFHCVTNSGARVDLGALTAPGLSIIPDMSYATLSASIVHVEGSAVHVGTADVLAGPAQPVALANSVLALCSALNDVLTAIGTGGLLSPPGGAGGPCFAGPSLVPALAAATSALVAASIGAAPITGPVASPSSTATGAL